MAKVEEMARSVWVFLGLVVLLAGQRLWELRLSRRNAAALLAQGGREYGASHWPWMVALHAGWFAAMIAEVVGRRRPFRPGLAAGAGLVFLAGQGLRYAAIRTLGPRWTTRVITVPGEPPVSGGIYRLMRHPNYVGVALEVAAFPLLHSAHWTALLFSAANALLLWVRIRAEEDALAADNRYLEFLADRPRFVPHRISQL